MQRTNTAKRVMPVQSKTRRGELERLCDFIWYSSISSLSNGEALLKMTSKLTRRQSPRRIGFGSLPKRTCATIERDALRALRDSARRRSSRRERPALCWAKLAAIYYTEPVTTYDADILFIASDETLSAGIPAIYSHLQSKGWRVDREHVLLKDFPVQFLAASGLTEEAVRNAKRIEYEGIPAKVLSPEYIIAIAASVGRHKDFARIEQMLDQVKIDKPLLDDILHRYNLKLRNK